MPKKPKPKIEEVTREFGLAHAEQADAKARMEKYKGIFYDLIVIPEDQLARQTIYYTGDDPEQHVATLYPKWRIIKKQLFDGPDDGSDVELEWRILIQEDPAKKSFVYVNPLDGKVYQRTVAESAPGVDLAKLEAERPDVYKAITFQPDPPPRELKNLDELTEPQKEVLKRYLLPVKLTNRMEKPRDPKPEELT
jgi:hypothetical protein